MHAWHGASWPGFHTRKVVEVAWARIQGLAALVARFRRSGILASFPPDAQPMMWDAEGRRTRIPTDA